IARGEKSLDVEDLLGSLDDLLIDLATMGGDHPLGYLLRHGKLRSVVDTVDHMAPAADNLCKAADHLRGLIYDEVHATYGRSPELSLLEDTWIPLLDTILRSDVPLELYTTNYDCIIETALESLSPPLADRIDIGHRESGGRPVLDLGRWHTDHSMLTKLHGSLDWRWSASRETIVPWGLTQRDGGNTVMLYPGYKGAPTEYPYSLFYEHLHRSILQTEAALFIGYAFRDRALNDILVTAPATMRKIILNPEMPTDSPFPPDSVDHIDSGFRDGLTSAVEMAFDV
ncbi:SIR2 family protein, partial [Candidatus Latescibacterota bacterium]